MPVNHDLERLLSEKMRNKSGVPTLTGNLSLVNPVSSDDGGLSGEVETNSFREPDGSPLSRQSAKSFLSLNAFPRAKEPTSEGYIEN